MSPRDDAASHDFQIRATGQNGWNEWSRFVLKELERLNDEITAVRTEITGKFDAQTERAGKMATDIALLQLKATMAGMVGGFVISLVVAYLRNHL